METTTLQRPKLINRLTRKQNFSSYPVGFSVISLTINIPMLEIRLESMQKNSKSTEMLNYCLQIGSVADCLTKKQRE